MSKPVALVFGGSGFTGASVVEGLLERNEFEALKPNLVSFQTRGTEVIQFDLAAATEDDLVKLFQTHKAHTIISALFYTETRRQYKMIDAAVKAGGVKRFVTSDWGTPGKRGLRKMLDEKLEIRDYVRKVGLPFTSIDVGFWYQNHLVIVDPKKAWFPWLFNASQKVFNDGTTKSAFIDLADVGKYTARIVSDDRTINRYVFVWGEEITQNGLIELARKYSPLPFNVVNETTQQLEASLSKLAEDPKDFPELTYAEYLYSLWVLGENIKEKAVLEEYGSALLGADLYPDFVPRRIEEHAKEYYAQ
ncbi:hypothetical protein AX16_004337 [Volvariella volvacea WC 439]|nr:hypothetical protein AX16_004337 [Volvariella volvacea WC 439]